MSFLRDFPPNWPPKHSNKQTNTIKPKTLRFPYGHLTLDQIVGRPQNDGTKTSNICTNSGFGWTYVVWWHLGRYKVRHRWCMSVHKYIYIYCIWFIMIFTIFEYEFDDTLTSQINIYVWVWVSIVSWRSLVARRLRCTSRMIIAPTVDPLCLV